VKKAIIVFSIILLAATGFRVWRALSTGPDPAATEGQAAEETARIASRKWAGAPPVPNMNEMFGIRIEEKAGEKTADPAAKGALKAARGKKSKSGAAEKTEPLPHLFGAFSEDGRWAALLKQEGPTDQKNKPSPTSGKEPGYLMVSQGEAVNAVIVEDVSAERVIFGLEGGEKRSIPLFDFDRTGIISLEYDAESTGPPARREVSDQTGPEIDERPERPKKNIRTGGEKPAKKRVSDKSKPRPQKKEAAPKKKAPGQKS
jgi:hypothetical protein